MNITEHKKFVRTKNGKLYSAIKYENDKVYFSNNSEDYITMNQISIASDNIEDLFEEHDFLEIEFYSARYDKRVSRLFEIEYIRGNTYSLQNAHMYFSVYNGEWTDIELKPIIKGIITRELISQIEFKTEINKTLKNEKEDKSAII